MNDALSFRADRYGYMLYYRGHPIGGAGVLRRGPMHWRHARANVRDNTAAEA